MTKEVCPHHLVIGAWLIIGGISLILLCFGAMEFNKYNFQELPCCSNLHTHEAWQDSFNASNHFYMPLIVFIMSNLFGFLLSNLHYRWIGLKECSI